MNTLAFKEFEKRHDALIAQHQQVVARHDAVVRRHYLLEKITPAAMSPMRRCSRTTLT